MSTQHTPGPWMVEQDIRALRYGDIIAADGRPLFQQLGSAPELLDALIAIFGDVEFGCRCPAYLQARAAIAKATTKEHRS